MFLSLLVSLAHAEDFVPDTTPYLLVQSWVTLYDQDENTLADPSGYGDPEDDIVSNFVVLVQDLSVNQTYSNTQLFWGCRRPMMG